MTAARFAGAVLAGGASRRMGRTKALLLLDGRPLVLRAADALRTAGAGRVIVVGGGEDIAALGEEHIEDLQPGAGPLHALLQVLEQQLAPVVAVVACDLPAIDGRELLALVTELDERGGDVAVSVVDGRRQWLHAAWARSATPVLRAAVDRGESSVHGATGTLVIIEVAPTNPASLHDVDRPEDMARYAQLDDDPWRAK